MKALEVQYVDLGSIKPRVKNPRTHTKKQINQIAESIKRFEFLNPILTNRDGEIIAGHGRWEGAKVAGLAKVPVVCVEHLSPEEIRAFVIADNKIAENGGWNRELLALELEELKVARIEGLSLGFDTAELEALSASLRGAGLKGADSVPQVDRAVPPVSRRGDLWLIEEHRLLCGDATSEADYETLLEGEKAGYVITDPPYNVPIKGFVSGLGKAQHPEFAMASGEMSRAEFTAFLGNVFGNLARFSRDGSIHAYCMDWRHMGEMLAAGEEAGLTLQNLCVWVKTNGGMGSLYRSRHELVFIYKNGSAPHINNVQLGTNGRNRTNVWEYPGENAFGAGRDAELAMHPTVKPVALVADAILDCSTRCDLVLDVFAGSGTSLVAADMVGRPCLGLEIDPYYVDTIIRRMAAVTGKTAVLAGTEQSFGEVAARRAPEGSENV